MGKIRIEYISIDEIEKWPRNPKDHDLEILGQSLDRFGFVAPLLVDENSGKLIAGHGRLDALLRQKEANKTPPKRIQKSNGTWRVPVLRGVRFKNNTEAESYLLADNNLTQLGGWNDEMLNNILSEMAATSENLLKGTGWNIDDIDFNIEPIQGLTDPDSVPDSDGKLICKPGELWILGNHRFLCGDATKKEDVERLMNGQKADMVFTDPPYGVCYAAKNEYLNEISKGNHIQVPIENDHKTEDEIKVLWKVVFEVIRDNLADVNSYYITGPQSQGMMMMMMMQEAGLPYRHVIIWVKNNHVLGRCDYNYKHEPIFFGWTKTHKFYGKGQFKTSVWEVAKPHKSDLHPTMKPVELIENAILNSSTNGQIVLDPFLGSGSTLIACEKTSRKCHGLEIDPHYCDVIIKRWEEFTGEKAVRYE